MHDKELIKICVLELSHKAGWADSGSWRQRDLEHLAAEIEKSTGTLISVSTIKRLLNEQFSQLPQAATLNAITAHLGYDGWQDFKLKKQEKAIDTDPLKSTPLAPATKSKKPRAFYTRAIPGFGVVVLIMVVSYSYFSKPDVINAKDIAFSVKKVTPHEIPNTVVFTYDVSNVEGDSFFIQQSWDRDRRVRIDKNNHTLTDVYYEPGYHNAKLIVNNTVVKTIDVSIPTNGWFFYMKPELFKGLPTYIHPSAPVRNGVLTLQPEDIIASKIDPQHENFYFYTLFPESFNVESDNFIFKTRVRFNALKNVKCPMIMHEVCGQNNSLFFFTTLPGCTGNSRANVGEHFMSGKTTDLTGFGCDVRQWHDVDVIVKNKEARFYINQKEIFRKSYTQSAGLITGLLFSSNGLCEIDHLKLKDLDGNVVYDFHN